ncbi:hypothetical protein [Phaeodactylibacter xiamenensis]|uniref:hypothetical protein n=1 Tax=Phaeodactylibacter xiamenensis TaxID=1524460 RepID=UPI0005920CBB|nr:hypothetical protein [Phaeodactylibacter xiamenensis]
MTLQDPKIEDLRHRLELTQKCLEQEPIALWQRLSSAVEAETNDPGTAKHEDNHLLMMLLDYWALRAMIEAYEMGKKGK